MKHYLFISLLLFLVACSGEAKSENDQASSENDQNLMINDTLCDCHSLDINRDQNIVHLATKKEGYTGWCIMYLRGGIVKEKRQYQNGMLNGQFITYHSNGQIESLIHHKNNKYDGWYYKFNEIGDTIYKRLYKNGQGIQ